MQGNRRRLERVMDSMMRGEGRVRGTGWNYPDDRPPLPLHTGEPVKVVLLGGSLSLRGWNYPDESFIRQLHKWLELTFIPGCRCGGCRKERGGGA